MGSLQSSCHGQVKGLHGAARNFQGKGAAMDHTMKWGGGGGGAGAALSN